MKNNTAKISNYKNLDNFSNFFVHRLYYKVSYVIKTTKQKNNNAVIYNKWHSNPHLNTYLNILI